MKYNVTKMRTLLKSIFTVDLYRVRKEYDDGSLFGEFERVNIDRGEAVAMVLYNRNNNTIVLVRQFRLAKYSKTGNGMLWEIPAGMIEAGEAPPEVAVRETLEETGYRIVDPEFMHRMILAPGVMNEYIHIYYAEINDADRVEAGGGLAEEGEHLEVYEITLEKAFEMIDNGEIDDAKTILGLLLLKNRLG